MLSHFSHVQLFATLWAVARQAPLSMVFLWQDYWSGLPFPPPGDLPNPGIKLISLGFSALLPAPAGKLCDVYFTKIKKNFLMMSSIQKTEVIL